MGDLIPGLPEEVARECLIRVGFDQFPVVRCISRLWKDEVESPVYHRLRKAEGLARPVLALAQAQPPLAVSGPAHKYWSAGSGGPANSYRLVLFDPLADMWAPLPALPDQHGSLPLFCQLAAVAGQHRRVVVVGGWDPETWAPTDAVYVYDFVTGAWRCGAPMPGPRRSFFACAAAGGVVFVAGGHDEEKNALRSAMAYDVEADAWSPLPDMAQERDEPRGVCAGGRFHVLGGYPTQAQGRFVGSGEAFDPATWSWGPVHDGVLEEGTCPRTCCAAAATESGDGRMYMLRDGHVAVMDGAAWRALAPVPEDGRTAAALAAIGNGRVVVVGSGCHGGDQAAYVLHEEAGKGVTWTRSPAPPEFSGHVQAACCVEI